MNIFAPKNDVTHFFRLFHFDYSPMFQYPKLILVVYFILTDMKLDVVMYFIKTNTVEFYTIDKHMYTVCQFSYHHIASKRNTAVACSPHTSCQCDVYLGVEIKVIMLGLPDLCTGASECRASVNIKTKCASSSCQFLAT